MSRPYHVLRHRDFRRLGAAQLLSLTGTWMQSAAAHSAIFFMGGPQLGEMEAGLVAGLFASTAVGVPVSIVSGGVLTVLATAWVAWRAVVVRGYASPPSPAG